MGTNGREKNLGRKGKGGKRKRKGKEGRGEKGQDFIPLLFSHFQLRNTAIF